MRKIRSFMMAFAAQEKWLNEMAHNGYRLIKCGKLIYDFFECQKDEYEYRVEFVGGKSLKEAQDYKTFLEDLGYRVMIKSMFADFSVGKVRFRPWADKGGKVSTTSGTYNKEIYIIEKKKDEKPFEVYTSNHDLSIYYRPIRNMYLTSFITSFIFTLIFLILNFIPVLSHMSLMFIIFSILFGIFSILLFIPMYIYFKRINQLKKQPTE